MKRMAIIITLLVLLVPVSAYAAEKGDNLPTDVQLRLVDDTIDCDVTIDGGDTLGGWGKDTASFELVDSKGNKVTAYDDYVLRINEVRADDPNTNISKNENFWIKDGKVKLWLSVDRSTDISLSDIYIYDTTSGKTIQSFSDEQYIIHVNKVEYGVRVVVSSVEQGGQTSFNHLTAGNTESFTMSFEWHPYLPDTGYNGMIKIGKIESSNPYANISVSKSVELDEDGNGLLKIYSDQPTEITISNFTLENYESNVRDLFITNRADEFKFVFEAPENTPDQQNCVVSFDNNGHGNKPNNQTVKSGNSITLPNLPDEKGYSLFKWSDGKKLYYPGDYVMIDSNVTFIAMWKPTVNTPSGKYVSVSFDNGGHGNYIGSMTANVMTSVILPEMKTWDDYDFVGWSDGKQFFKAGAEYPVFYEDLTFTAIWKKNTDEKPESNEIYVSFDNAGHGYKPADMQVKKGDYFSLPDLGKSGDYIFKGWSDGTRQYAPGAYVAVNKNTKFYAQWEKNSQQKKIIITFNTGGHGVQPGSITTVPDTTIKLPNMNNDGAYVFTGWSDGNNTYSSGAELKVTENKTFYAQWKKDPTQEKVVVSFNNAGRGSKPSAQTVNVNSNITLPDLGTVGEYVFKGWMDGQKLYKPGAVYTATRNIALYAHWEKINQTYTVNFVNTGGVNIPSKMNVASGTSIQLPNLDDDGNYIFKGWTDGSNNYRGKAYVTINKNTTFIATWQLKEQTRPSSIHMYIGEKQMTVDDDYVEIDAAPYIKNDRTYVPIRALAEGFKAEVIWDDASNSVTINLDGNTIIMNIGSIYYWVNGYRHTMDVAPEISSEGRTYVPIRFVAEALNFSVYPSYNYDGTTASVLFSYMK